MNYRFTRIVTCIVIFAMAASAFALPSYNYDDYDLEKYEELARQQDSRARQAEQQERRAHENFERQRGEYTRSAAQLEKNIKEQDQVQRRQERQVEELRNLAVEQQRQQDLVQRSSAELSQIQSELNEAEASVRRLAPIASDLKSRYEAERSNERNLQKVVEQKQSELEEARRQEHQQMIAVERLKKAHAEAPEDRKAEIKRKLDAETARLEELSKAKGRASNAERSAQTDLNRQKPKTADAEAKWENANTELKAAESRQQTAANRQRAKSSELEKAKQELARLQNREPQLKDAIERDRRQIADYQQNIDRLKREVERQGREMEQAERQWDRSRKVRIEEDREFRRLIQYVEWIRQNIQSAGAEIAQDGARDGAFDGDREGRELGTQRGEEAGRRQGLAQGQAAGERAGRDRDYRDGQNQGLEKATELATAEATPKALGDAQNNGLADGTREGLLAAYNLGYREGLEHGEKTGSDKVAYDNGRKRGEADGLAQAIDEAKVEQPRGYKQREGEYLNAKLKKEEKGPTLPLAKAFEGVQGRQSESGDDRYYQPRPGNYPHPRLRAFYFESYDFNYRSSLEASYREAYRVAEEVAYDTNYRSSYRAAYDLDYADSRQAGFDQSYNENYGRIYQAVYRKVYDQNYPGHYQAAYDANKEDQGQIDLGFAAGNAKASTDKGYREGHKHAHSTNLEIEKKKAFQAGVEQADQLYMNNPVIKVESILLADSDGDGVYRPGESMQTISIIKNFGLVAKTDLESHASLQQGSLSIVQATSKVPSISGQSETRVTGIEQIAVQTSAADGSSFMVRYDLQDAKSLVAQKSFSGKVLYPSLVQILDFDGILVPGESQAIKVKVLNRSQKAQNLQLSLLVDASKVELAQAVQNISNLAAQAESVLTFKPSGRIDAMFEESDIEFMAQSGGIVFGGAKKKITIIKRHSVSKDSLGLLLSQNMAVGGAKALFKLAKLDTWDLRVDGQLKTQSLDPYAKKLIHVMGDRNSRLDTQTATSLREFVKKGGNIVIWGAELASSNVLDLVKAGVRASGSMQASGLLVGQDILGGLSLNANAVAELTADSPFAKSILAVSGQSVGSSSADNGLLEKVGHIYVLSMRAEDLSQDQFQALNKALELANLGFEEKLKLAQSKAAFVTSVLFDILEEIRAADYSKGNFYKDNDKKNKIMRAAVKLIKETDKKSATRKAFASLYPNALEAIAAMKSSDVAASAKLVLTKKTGIFDPSWRDAYCSENSKSQLCKDDNSGRK